MEILKICGMTPATLAQKLDVNTGQVYKWNKQGISKHNPHFKKLKEILPEVQPKEELLRKDGEKDGRYRCGRKRKKLELTDTELPSYEEKEFESTLFPKIYWNKKPH